MIRAETTRREAGKEPGRNVKLGRGGIREIEFITQTFQIIRGGREPALQGKGTLAMLAELAEHGALTPETAVRLSADYIFLRNVEHALQYVDDKQTQVLSDAPEVHEKIAAMLGMSAAELETRLAAVNDFVAGVFDGIFHIEVGNPDGMADRVGNAGGRIVEAHRRKINVVGVPDVRGFGAADA